MDTSLHLPDLNYDCVRCGRSCRTFRVGVSLKKMPALRRTEAAQAAIREGYKPLRLVDERTYQVMSRPNGNCLMLNEDGLCGVQVELGPEAKPTACTAFPFSPMPSPGGYYLGLSFVCHAVQNQLGRDVEAHREQATQLMNSRVEAGVPSDLAKPVVPLLGDRVMPWADYLVWEDSLRERLSHNGVFVKEAFKLLNEEATPPRLAFVAHVLDRVTGSTLALVESATQPERINQVTQALCEGEPFYSARLDSEVPALEPAPVFAEQVNFYLEHVLFRKFLIRGDLIGRLLFLEVKKRFLAYFCVAGGRVTG